MRNFFLFMLVCLTGFYASGQGAKYIVKNYNLMDELSLNGSVWSFVQDTNGLLFFGADNGVVVNDGAYWDLVSQNQSTIRSLFLDEDNRLYYGGVNDFGLVLHDMNKGFYFSSMASSLADSLRLFGDIWSINECGNELFFQSRNRIFILDSNGLRSCQVSDSYHRGFVLDTTYVVNQKDIGMTCFQSDGFQLLPGGSFFKEKTISCMMELPVKKILIGTRKNGIFQYDPLSGRISDPFPAYPRTNEFLARNQLYHGIALPDGTLAFATLYHGTIIVSQEGRILKMLDRQHGLRDNVHYALGISNDNNVWMCTSNGISSYNMNSPFIFWDYTSGIDGVILDIQSFGNDMFIGSLTGLYQVPAGNTCSEMYQTGIVKLLDSEVWDIAEVVYKQEEIMFTGTGLGLFSYDGLDFHLERPSGIILKVIQVKTSPELLLALRSDDLDIYRWEGRKYVYAATVTNIYSGLRTVAQDSKGYLWIGTRGSGIIQVPVSSLTKLMPPPQSTIDFRNIDQGSTKTYRLSSELTDVFEYEGTVIFSNNDGLFQFNYLSEIFERCLLFGPEITGYKKMIISLKQDYHRNIWVGGEDLFLYHPDGTYTLDKLHFQQPGDIFSAFIFFHDTWQRTWIGGNNGIYLYDSRIDNTFPSHLKTILNRIIFNNDSSRLLVNASRLATEDSPGQGISEKHPLTIDLTKRNSQVIFYFALPFFESEKRTVYSYMLEGYSGDWSSWTDLTSVTFSNLEPAQYTFKVRAKTIYEQIAQPAEVTFVVPQPWFSSRLAIIVYFVLMSLLVYLIAHQISVIKVRKQLRLEDIIQKRIQETKLATILNSLQIPVANASGHAQSPALKEKVVFSGPDRLPSGQDFLNKTLKILDYNMNDPDFSVKQFCGELGMSQARVYRKVISLTSMSITQFIRNIRLKRAAQMLIETDLSISEVAYQTGFSNPGYFTKCFKKEFGKNPKDFAQNKKHLH